MNASKFVVKRSRIKVMVGSNMPKNTLFAFVSMIYLGYLLTEFDQTFTTNRLWGKEELVKFWGQKVNGQGHGGIKYVDGGTIVNGVITTIWSCWKICVQKMQNLALNPHFGKN